MKKSILMILVLLAFGTMCVKVEEKKNGFTVKGNYAESDVKFFTGFFSQMQQAVKDKNLDKSLSFYSKDFMSDEGADLNQIRKNTAYIYENYDNIIYVMKNIKINIKDNSAVSVDEFEYKADSKNKKLKNLNYTGRERIYWQKENGDWKIINWIYEQSEPGK